MQPTEALAALKGCIAHPRPKAPPRGLMFLGVLSRYVLSGNLMNGGTCTRLYYAYRVTKRWDGIGLGCL